MKPLAVLQGETSDVPCKEIHNECDIRAGPKSQVGEATNLFSIGIQSKQFDRGILQETLQVGVN